MRRAYDSDPTPSGSQLRKISSEAGGHVDAVTKDVVPADDNVTLVNADPELDGSVLRHFGVTLGHPALDLDSTAESASNAVEGLNAPDTWVSGLKPRVQQKRAPAPASGVGAL
jgi:hypothetical protein